MISQQISKEDSNDNEKKHECIAFKEITHAVLHVKMCSQICLVCSAKYEKFSNTACIACAKNS